MERKVLGRGLEALIPQGVDQTKEKVQSLKTEQVHASRFQQRLTFSPEKIEELASSIREKGVIQPILVREMGQDRYELIARISDKRVADSKPSPRNLRRSPQYLVPDVMAVGIVHSLEAVEIHHHQHERVALPLGAASFLIEETVHVSGVR